MVPGGKFCFGAGLSLLSRSSNFTSASTNESNDLQHENIN